MKKGQRVICVDAKPFHLEDKTTPLIEGNSYVIKCLFEDGVQLEGIKIYRKDGTERRFFKWRFKPDIEVVAYEDKGYFLKAK